MTDPKPSAGNFISNFDINQAGLVRDGGIVKFQMNHKRELFDGLIRLHVLLHAAHEPIFGLAMMHELAHHGYRVGPGTLYPLMHGLERAGLLKSSLQRAEGRRRRLYRITPAGKRALEKARVKVDELHRELHEEGPRRLVSESGA
jgi:DNA-binding PadR family transcriptional regulator